MLLYDEKRSEKTSGTERRPLLNLSRSCQCFRHFIVISSSFHLYFVVIASPLTSSSCPQSTFQRHRRNPRAICKNACQNKLRINLSSRTSVQNRDQLENPGRIGQRSISCCTCNFFRDAHQSPKIPKVPPTRCYCFPLRHFFHVPTATKAVSPKPDNGAWNISGTSRF